VDITQLGVIENSGRSKMHAIVDTPSVVINADTISYYGQFFRIIRAAKTPGRAKVIGKCEVAHLRLSRVLLPCGAFLSFLNSTFYQQYFFKLRIADFHSHHFILSQILNFHFHFKCCKTELFSYCFT